MNRKFEKYIYYRLIVSETLSVSGDRVFDTAKVLLCIVVLADYVHFAKKILKSGVVVAISRVVLSFKGYDSYSQSLF